VPVPSVDNDSELMTGVNGVMSNADFGASEVMAGINGVMSEFSLSNSSALNSDEGADMVEPRSTGYPQSIYRSRE
jgi:hypothetical protein